MDSSMSTTWGAVSWRESPLRRMPMSGMAAIAMPGSDDFHLAGPKIFRPTREFLGNETEFSSHLPKFHPARGNFSPPSPHLGPF